MTTRTVRMTPEDEARLARIQRETGWSASDALKEGVRLLCEKLSNAPTSTAWDHEGRSERSGFSLWRAPGLNGRKH